MRISENISLGGLNSFGVEARAARLVEWETAEELVEIFGRGEAEGAVAKGESGEGSLAEKSAGRTVARGIGGGGWMALGGGNNVLFTGDFDGTLVKSAARGIKITGESEEALMVRAEAGVDWGDFTEWCIGHGLWGVENLSGIPGSVGAAPIQNIGAYGAEVKDVIVSVECFAVEAASFLTLAAEHCGFGYRDSVFKGALKGRVIVTAVNFELSKVPRPNLRYAALAEKVAESERRLRISEVQKGVGEREVGPTLESIGRAVVEIRNSKLPDPRVMGNAGSFFKNPVVDTSLAHRIAAEYPDMPLYPAGEAGKSKLAAGWLIERAGWKGRSEGRVGIHPQQALIVVNLGGATGGEIVELARRVQADVKARFGVELETEVNIIC